MAETFSVDGKLQQNSTCNGWLVLGWHKPRAGKPQKGDPRTFCFLNLFRNLKTECKFMFTDFCLIFSVCRSSFGGSLPGPGAGRRECELPKPAASSLSRFVAG